MIGINQDLFSLTCFNRCELIRLTTSSSGLLYEFKKIFPVQYGIFMENIFDHVFQGNYSFLITLKV